MATGGAIRRSVTRSELRLNLLRICSREPRTSHDLIHAPSYPGIETNLFTIQSEIGVTIELGECKNRELLVRVGQVSDPIVPDGYTELLRTSLLAFLLVPELAYAEPEAYALYLDAWFSAPAVTEDLGAKREGVHALFLAFPELAHRLFYVAREGTARRAGLPFGLPETEWIRVFGLYHLADLPTGPIRLKAREAWAALRRPPLPAGWAHLGRQDLGSVRNPWIRRILRGTQLLPHRLPATGPLPFAIAPLAGPELMKDRGGFHQD
ncbi:MAG TPA: hypothetical protein ENN53_02445 [Candidatus Acetothermia bacterium]|nr:hypothetical protein [Candidatus Acetothermia bacterium]